MASEVFMSIATTTTAPSFELDSGLLALDFTNTVHDWTDPTPRDDFSQYTDLLAFGQQAHLIHDAELEHLAEVAARRPREATATLALAKAVRETIFRIMSALASGGYPDEDDIYSIQTQLNEALTNRRLVSSGRRFHWEWTSAACPLDRPLWPVIQSAVDFLTDGDIDRLRMCAADDCSWFFIDNSRNKSRKWCSMETCGNRAKIARYRERHEGHASA